MAFHERDLQKAMAHMGSHRLNRTSEGRFAAGPIEYVRPRTPEGRFGKRLSPGECAGAEQLALQEQAELGARLREVQDDFQQKRFSETEASARGKASLQASYERLFRHGMQAAGSPGILLSPQEKAAIGRVVRDEQDFWAGFMADMDKKAGAVPYERRVGLYGMASLEAFWLGFCLGDTRKGRRIRWVMGKTESHCDDCRKMAAKKPVPVREFLTDYALRGIVPRSGLLSCRGFHCLCRLEEA